MKILFFSYAFPNRINPGLGTFNRTMIAGLAHEHDVRVVSPVPFTDVWKAWSAGRLPRGLNDSTFQAVPNVPAEYCTWYYTPKFFRTSYGQFMQRSVGSTLNRVMQEFRPDVVLSYWTHPDGEVAVNTAHRFGVRAVTMVGGSDVLINGRSSSRRKPILDVLHAADGVVTVSEDIKQVLIADGIPCKKISVSRRGIDRRMFHEGDRFEARRKLGLSDDRSILISVGRLVEVKGHTHLIEACRLLAGRGCDFRCYLLGDGPLRATLQKQIDELGLAKMIEVRGSQTSAQLADWYRAANLSVLASLSEGVPNVLLESISCGTPFVASNVGGIPEIADLLRDSLVPAGNHTAMADAIAARLSVTNAVLRKPRRFLPPTALESAEDLSSILRSVQTGKSRLSLESAFMHETMTETDLSNERQAATDVPVGMTWKSDTEKTNDTAVNQTDDHSHLHELSTFSGVNPTTSYSTNSNPIGSANCRKEQQPAPAAAILPVPAAENSDDDSCARTGEHCNLRVASPAPVNHTSPSTVESDFAEHASRDPRSKSEITENVQQSPSCEADEMDFDPCGRTAEGFFYIDAEHADISHAANDRF